MKRRILALILALVMAVGLVMPASAEGLDGATTFGGDGAPVVITGDGVTTPPPADTDTPTTGDSVPTPPTTGDSTTTPPTTTPPAAPVDGEDEDESDTPMPLAMASPMSVGAAPTTKSVEYVDENGATKTVTATEIIGGSATATTGYNNKNWTEGWYYVEGAKELGGDEIKVSGNVNLILCDDATLTSTVSLTGARYGIDLAHNAKLTIYGQSKQNGTLRSIVKVDGSNTGNLIINGGVVEATGGDVAGIYSLSGSLNVTVNNGTVNATGGDYLEYFESCGINLGNGRLTINGGKVIATGGVLNTVYGKSYGIKGNVTFNGGTLIAKGAGTSGKAIETAPTLPATYYWRTAASGEGSDFTPSTIPYTHNDENTYVELTTQPSGGRYLSYKDWDAVNKKLVDAAIATASVTQITASTSEGESVIWGMASNTTWYYVSGDVSISQTVKIRGDVHLILCDGAKLTVTENNSLSSGIDISQIDETTGSLTIYGQSAQTGALESTANNFHGIQIIGGSSLTINGGHVTGTSASQNIAYNGIHVGNEKSKLTVNSGTLIAKTTKNKSAAMKIESGKPDTPAGTLNLPTTYWWRMAETGDSAKYKTQNRYTNSALEGEYFELTTTEQTTNVQPDPAIPYVDASGEAGSCNDYTVLRSSDDDVTLTGGWYVVNSNVTIDGTLTIAAGSDVHLILCNGATLTVNKGVEVVGETENSGSLTIYGQDGQTGKLVANGTADVNGVFGISSPGYNALTINGGVIEATGADDSRSAGSTEEDAMNGVVNQSYGIHAMYLVINGGKVTAKGGKAVGVPAPNGEGSAYSCGIKASEMTVTGGKVEATGGAATGNGNVVMSCGINASEMTVTGGEIEATGGTATNTAGASATSVGIYATRDMAIGDNGKVTATGDTAVADKGTATSNGIEAGSMTVGSVSVAYAVGDDTPATTGAVVNATGGTAKDTSGGIVVERGISINSGTVTATGGVAGRSIGVVSNNEISVAGDATLTATGGSSTENFTVEESYGIMGMRLWMGDLETSGNAEVTATGGTATKSCGIEVIEGDDTPMVLLNGGKLTAIGANYGINVTNWGGSAAAYALDDGSTEDTGASQGTVTIMKGTLIADATGTGHGLDLDRGDGESYSLVCPAAYWWRINKAVNGYRQFPGNAYVHNDLNDYVEITTEGEGLPLLPGGETHKHTRRQNTAVADLIPTPDKTDVASPETFDAGIAVYAVMGALSATASAAWIGRRKK